MMGDFLDESDEVAFFARIVRRASYKFGVEIKRIIMEDNLPFLARLSYEEHKVLLRSRVVLLLFDVDRVLSIKGAYTSAHSRLRRLVREVKEEYASDSSAFEFSLSESGEFRNLIRITASANMRMLFNFLGASDSMLNAILKKCKMELKGWVDFSAVLVGNN